MRTVLVLYLLAGLAACGGDDAGGGGITDPPNPDRDADGFVNQVDACPDHPEVLNRVWDFDGCPDTPLDLYDALRSDLETFWAEALLGVVAYRRLTAFHAYTASLNTPCGELGPGASYCSINERVYYDSDFVGELLEISGDIAPAFIIGHVFGHHVSNLLGWLTEPGVSPKVLELQADCFAGAWRISADRGVLEVREVDEATVEVAAVLRMADLTDKWFDPTQHGTEAQRSAAFATGFDGGMESCTTQAFFDRFSASAE